MASVNKGKKQEETPVDQVLRELDVNPDEGLSSNEAASRKEKYGPNEIEAEKRNPVLELLSHFWGPIPWMIEAAVILSAIAGRWEDFTVIFTMLLINSGVGYWHESKATHAMEALKAKLAPETHIIRNGNRKKIPASESCRTGGMLFLKNH